MARASPPSPASYDQCARCPDLRPKCPPVEVVAGLNLHRIAGPARTLHSIDFLRALAEPVADTAQRLVKRDLWPPPEERMDAPHVRHASLHVFEAGGIRFFVWDEHRPRRAVRHLPDPLREIENADLLGAADVKNLSRGSGMLGKTEERLHHISHI